MKLKPLSQKRMMVLHAIAEGLTDRQIGQRFRVSERTIGTQVREILWATGANNRAHAVAIGYQQGWLSNETA